MTTTSARTSSDTAQSKHCFRTLPLVYHPKGQNEASYNSEMLQNHPLSLKTNIFKNEFYFVGIALQYRTTEMGFSSCEIEKDYFTLREANSNEKPGIFESKMGSNVRRLVKLYFESKTGMDMGKRTNSHHLYLCHLTK